MIRTSRRTFICAGLFAAGLATPALAEPELKVGFVYVGPVGDHGWTYQHDQGRQAIEEAFGDRIETTFVESVKEGPDAERVIRQLAASGHGLIFTTSFGFMDPTIKGRQTVPGREVRACHRLQARQQCLDLFRSVL